MDFPTWWQLTSPTTRVPQRASRCRHEQFAIFCNQSSSRQHVCGCKHRHEETHFHPLIGDMCRQVPVAAVTMGYQTTEFVHPLWKDAIWGKHCKQWAPGRGWFCQRRKISNGGYGEWRQKVDQKRWRPGVSVGKQNLLDHPEGAQALINLLFAKRMTATTSSRRSKHSLIWTDGSRCSVVLIAVFLNQYMGYKNRSIQCEKVTTFNLQLKIRQHRGDSSKQHKRKNFLKKYK